MYTSIIKEQLVRMEALQLSAPNIEKTYFHVSIYLKQHRTMHLNFGRRTGKTYFANKFKEDNPGTTILINNTNKIPLYEHNRGRKYINQTFPDITNLKYVIIDEPRFIKNWENIYAILVDFYNISDVSIILLGDI